MGVELSDDEAWGFLETAHTAVVTTLRRDGWPMGLPAWLVTADRAIYIRKMASSGTVRSLRRDPRVCVTAERGLAWADLCAVVVRGEAEIFDDGATLARVERLLAAKYAGYRRETGPAAVEQHYARPVVALRIVPTHALVSWDNSRILR